MSIDQMYVSKTFFVFFSSAQMDNLSALVNDISSQTAEQIYI